MKLSDIILKEGINDNISKIDISYTNHSRFYKMKVDGKTLYFDEAEEMIKGLTGLDLPARAWDTSDEVIEIINALKAKGIEAQSWEMDVD